MKINLLGLLKSFFNFKTIKFKKQNKNCCMFDYTYSCGHCFLMADNFAVVKERDLIRDSDVADKYQSDVWTKEIIIDFVNNYK